MRYLKWVRHLEPGRYRLRFEARGWTPAETEVEVGEGEARVALKTEPR